MNITLAIVPLALLLGYLSILLAILIRRRITGRTERILTMYLVLSILWDITVAFALGTLNNDIVTQISDYVALAGQVLLSIVFFSITYAFLRKAIARWIGLTWGVLGGLYLVLFVLLVVRVLPLEVMHVSVGQISLQPEDVLQILSILTWSLFTLAAIRQVWHVYRQATSPMHRNRYRYLLLALLLLVLGDAFFASRQSPYNMFGIVARFSSVLVLTLVTYTHNLVDIKTVYRRAFGYIVSTFLVIAIGFGLMWGTLSIWKGDWISSALVGVGLASLFLSFASAPMRRGIQRVVDRRLFNVESADYDSVLRAYGERVIETLRLEPLADLVMSTLLHATGVGYGGLYLVREGKREVGGLLFDPLLLLGQLPPGDFELHPDSPLAAHLQKTDEPISQYDIDLRASFADVPANEREWLRSMSVELLLPIHTSDKLVGLIVLGPKDSGEVYTAKDVEWLKSLADQTAVALQNARLFDQVESMSISMMRLNAELQIAYQKLQQLDKLKSDFIGIITHELRSPFVAAGFSVQLLERYVQKQMYGELPDQVRQLNKELTSGRQMIDKVISFASLLSKQGELNLEETDIAALVRDTIVPLETMARSRNIRLSLHLAEELPMAEVDSKRLGEAMYHMVHNAIKFNREGGQARISCWSENSRIVFQVDDTGKGIAADQLSTIWNVFTQAADNVKRGVEGLGLGLPLIKLVTEAHGGEVWVSSEVGKGSIFGFKIPIRQAKLPSA